MSVSRNDPCPCGSGKKYKKCCLTAPATGLAQPAPSPRFRFEHGSYGGPGQGFMPSAICYEQIAPGQWSEHFCLVNPTHPVDDEDEASAIAEADFREAFAAKVRTGEDTQLAVHLKKKGYVTLDGFRIARD